MLEYAQRRVDYNPCDRSADKIYRFEMARLPRHALLSRNKKLKQAAKIWTCVRP